MVADNLALHLQNLYIVCGTAIPVLFVALAVQIPSTGSHRLPVSVGVSVVGVTAETTVDVPVSLQRLGLLVMVVGEIAALAALVFDWTSVVWQVVAIAGVLAGALFVAASVAPTPTSDPANSAPAPERSLPASPTQS